MAKDPKNDGVRRPWSRRPASLLMSDSPRQPVEASHEGNLAGRLTHVAVIMGMVAALVGAGHLAAWLGGYMTKSGLSTITMKTNAALCLTLVGTALMLLVPAEVGSIRRWAARICAVLALLVGLLTFTENLSGWDFGIDQMLAAETPGALAVVNPNRMGMPASLSFTLIGLALLILSRRDHRRVRAVQALALAACLIALLPTIGFLYGAQQLYGIARYTGIAWPTAVSLLLMGLGLLCARPAVGLMAQVTANDPGGANIRRLLPAFVILPLLLGWLRLAGERVGHFDAPTGTGMMMLLFIVIFSTLTYHAGRRASRSSQALRESEQRFRALYEQAPLGIARIDSTTGRFLLINATYCGILQRTEAEALQLDFQAITHPDDLAPDLENMQRLRDGLCRSFEMDKRYLRPDGSIVWVNLTVVPEWAEGQPPSTHIAMVVDITERTRAEAALHESEERFRTMANAMPQLAWIAQPDGSIVWYNQRWYQYTDTTAEQMAGWGWQSVHDPVELPKVLERWKASIATGEPFEMTFPLRGADGVFRLFLTRGFPLKDAGGRVVQWFGTNTDVSELKRAEEALRRLAQFPEENPNPVLRIAADGTLLYANLPAQALLAVSGAAADQPLPAAMHALAADAARRGSVIERELTIEGGRTFWWSAVRPGNEAYVNLYGRDITDRKRAEDALRELNATLETRVARRTAELQWRTRQLQKLTLELTQAEERERRRVAVILHEDLQQQIAGARFHLSLVRNRTRDDRERADIAKVEGVLKDAIEQSRTLSHDLSPTVLHMNDLAEALHWLAGRVRAQQGLSVKMDASGDMALHSEALAIFLFRAAQEMLFNVVKHAGVREAAIRARRIGHYVCLTVSDRGRGFDPQKLKETSGLGLFSLRERVELLGGRMKIKSVQGKGSRFLIVVPDNLNGDSESMTMQGVPANGVASTTISPPVSGAAVRVLLVDDHDVVRAGLAALLREAPGVDLVGEAADGRAAIDMAAELRPDVVLMDVSMPLMKGDEATRQIKAYLPQTRVIGLSMYDEPEKKQKMFEAGAEDYILKTVSAEELLAAIRGD